MSDSDTVAIRELAKQAVLAARSNTGDAERLLSRMESLTAERPSDISEAFCIRVRGNLHQVRGDMTAAVETYRRAHQIFEQAGDIVEAARTAASLVGALGVLGEFQEAFRWADRARVVFQEVGEDFRLARLEVNVGTLYQRLGRMADALACYDGVVPIQSRPPSWRSTGPSLSCCSIVSMRQWRASSAPTTTANRTGSASRRLSRNTTEPTCYICWGTAQLPFAGLQVSARQSGGLARRRVPRSRLTKPASRM